MVLTISPRTVATTVAITNALLSSPVEACKTQASLREVAEALRLEYEVNDGHAAGTIRLVYHDAGTYDPLDSQVGGPTGCLAVSDENAGLGRITTMIEKVLKKHLDTCSRADIWALAGLVSGDLLLNQTDSTLFVDQFQWGRITDDECQYKIHRLPGHQLNCEDSFEILSRPGFNAREVAALMGAHSVGTAHKDFSGFRHAWDNTPDVLDNDYFDSMLHDEWGRVRSTTITGFEAEAGDRFWILFHGGAKEILMLNADMCLGWEIGDNDKNTPMTAENSCQVNWKPQVFNHHEWIAIVPPGANATCPRQTEFDSREWSVRYRDDNQLFLDDFLAVFLKLERLGYQSVTDTRGYELCAPCADEATTCCCGSICLDIPAPAPVVTQAPIDTTPPVEEPEQPSEVITKDDIKDVADYTVARESSPSPSRTSAIETMVLIGAMVLLTVMTL